MKHTGWISDNKIYALKSLYPGKTSAEIRRLLLDALKKRMLKLGAVTAVLILLFALASVFSDREERPAVYMREDVNGAAREIPVMIRDESGEHEFRLTLNPVVMSDEEIDAMHEKLVSHLDLYVQGENPSMDEVMTDLRLFTEVEGFPVRISWSTSDPALIRTDGKVQNAELQKETQVTLCAKVSYGSEFRLYERHATVVPARYGASEGLFKKRLKDLQAYESSTANSREFNLPTELDGAEISPIVEREVSPFALGLFLAAVLLIGGWSSFFGALNDKKKARFLKAEADCKVFLSKLSLLLAAGLPLRGAWKKMTDDFGSTDGTGMLYENMAVTCREFLNGNPENTAYERFGERMELTRYQRIAGVLSQAVTKGVSELPEILASEIKEAVADERERIKIRGEQAGTKLLMPMTGFLIIVFAILMVPAFVSF